MTQSAVFKWHENAKLFAGANQIARPAVSDPKEFLRIAAQPTPETLSTLGGALVNGSSFCVSERPIPDTIQTNVGHFLTLTGGSSGQPKVILRTQASWITSFDINAAQFSLTSHDSVAVFGKLSHSLALYGVLEALHLGLNAYALDGLRPRTQCDLIITNGVTVLYATPTQLRLLAQHAAQMALPNVRLIMCGGGALDQNTIATVKALCPNAAVHAFYGAAETSFITLSDSETPAGSAGSAYPNVKLRILDPNGKPTIGIGDVWVQSPYLFERYLSEGSTDTRWQDGFVTVGEMGQLDAMGNLWLKGRRTRMVTIADQNIFPEVVETLITDTAEFGPCAVIPIPDNTRGHRLILVLQGAQDNKIAQAARNACRKKLGAIMTPHKVLFHPSLPLLSSGKLDMITLSEWIGERQ